MLSTACHLDLWSMSSSSSSFTYISKSIREGFVGKKGLSQQNAACHLDPSII